MPLPTVAIVGRPNVGKSTLFNRLVGKKLALVDDRPGVTRDRREGEASLLGLEFRVIDTAGFEDEDPASLPGRMRRQTEAAVREADAALFLIDAREGVTPLDEEIARWLRAESTPVTIVANKAEGRSGESGILESYRLGFGDPVALSAEHGEGIADLFDAIRGPVEAKAEQEEAEDEEDEDFARPAAQARHRRAAQRRQVDPGQPDARRGADDHRPRGRHHPRFDHARLGMGRAARSGSSTPRACASAPRSTTSSSACRSPTQSGRSTMPRSSCCCWTPPAASKSQDLKIADQVIEEGRGLIIAVNKWDVAEEGSSLFNGIKAALTDGLAQLRDVPLLTVSAKTGKGIDTILKVAFELREAWSRRVSTGELNRWFERGAGHQPAACAQGPADQASLHHPDQEPPADLHRLRQPHRRAARKLPPLPGQRASPRPQARRGPASPRIPRRPQSVRQRQAALSQA